MKLNTAQTGLLLGFALILSYVESLIPFSFGVPGIKLGLANLAVVLALYLFDVKQALCIDILRVALSGFLFGNLYTILYSAAGALLSFAAMVLSKRYARMSVIGVSIGGGVCHNIGQLLAALFVIRTLGVVYYLPVLLTAGAITGGLIGILARQLLPLIIRIKPE